MRRFYVPDKIRPGETVLLGPEETRHLRNVLRLREGDLVNIFDGEGGEFLAEVREISKNSIAVLVGQRIAPSAPESALVLTLAVAILKGEKFELVVQKAVELGVKRLVPLVTARGDVKPKDAAGRAERWRRIGLEAAKQCGRAALMKIDEPLSFADYLGILKEGVGGEMFFFSERGGESFPDLSGVEKMTAFIGPEGGWDESEIELAREAGFRVVTLGGRTLRAETAAIAIAAIIQHRFGDLS
jgi:16S rRNA (uracil1498-N3)-methyltransferase